MPHLRWDRGEYIVLEEDDDDYGLEITHQQLYRGTPFGHLSMAHQ